MAKTVDPNLENFDGRVQASYGDFNTWRAAGALSIPILKNQVGLRLSVDRTESDGFTDNTFLNRDDIDARENTTIRGKVLIAPEAFENLEIRLMGTLIDSDIGEDRVILNRFTGARETEQNTIDRDLIEAQQFSARLELRQGVDGGHDGLYGEPELKYNGSFEIGQAPIFFSVGPVITFGDDAYNSTFFDVSAAQSAASGLSQFDAGGGINSYGLHASAVLPLSESTSLVGFVNYDQLAGDIADSSIVQERGSENQTTVGLLLSYSF